MILETLQRCASFVAAWLGHQLEPWERDSQRSSVASCRNCRLFAVVDGRAIYGSTLKVSCAGDMTAPLWDRNRKVLRNA